MVPTEEVVEIRGGQRRKSERKLSRATLVQMVVNDASWHPVRAPRVMGFIGGTSDRPAPISDKQVERSRTVCSRVARISRGRKRWSLREMVRVGDGPFTDFMVG